ncbi:MAG: hypothetical protein IT260_18695 [Saprospiraceae bacterium]|nr:hypothetical protein [Saprospiraceae bacterium]
MKSIFLIPVFFFAFAGFTLSTAQNAKNTNNGTPAEPTFQDFLAQFPKASLPFSFQAEELQAQLEKRASAPKAKRLSWEYFQFLPTLEESARFSRMPVYPEPVASFETPEYYAVLYNTGRGLTKNFKSYHVAIFDKQGNHIATHFVAGVNTTTLTTATIDETLHAKVQAFEINWSKDLQANGLDGNSILNLTPAGRQSFELTSGGMVEQVNWSYKPSSLTASTKGDAK